MIGLRPDTGARFSNNYFHETWHVLSDRHGARLFGRLLWGLAYQRRRDMFVVIDRPFIDPTPFEAAPARPIVLVPSWLGALRAGELRALGARLPLTDAPDGTVRWHTRGLDQVDDAADDEDYEEFLDRHFRSRDGALAHAARCGITGGMLWFAPRSPTQAKQWAVAAYDLPVTPRFREDAAYLDWPWVNGEVQVFADYRRMVRSAGDARRRVLAAHGEPADPDGHAPEIWEVAAERRAAASHRPRR